MFSEPVLLPRRGHGDEQDVRFGAGDGVDELVLLGLAEISVMPPAQDEPRIPAAELADRALQDIAPGAEDVDAISAGLRKRQELEHEIDAGHSLGQRSTEESRCPDDRLAVRRDER